MTSFRLLSLAHATAADDHPTLMQPPGIARRADATVVRCAQEVLPIREDDGIHPVAADDTAPAFHVSMPAIDPLRCHETTAPTADRVSRRYLWLFGCHVPSGDHGRPFSLAGRNAQPPTFVILEKSMEHALWAPSMTNRKWWEDRRNCRIDSLGRNVPTAWWGVSGQTAPRAVAKCASPSPKAGTAPIEV